MWMAAIVSICLLADPAPRFKPATPELVKQSTERAGKIADEASTELKVKLNRFESAHFLVFTDWDRREEEFLKSSLEAAHTSVAKVFDVPVTDDVFVGKLPVYVFNDMVSFQTFAREYGYEAAPDSMIGYFVGSADGTGHIGLRKPVKDARVRDPQRAFARVLLQQVTRAFVARYRTNETLPRWLDEGIGLVVADEKFPDPQSRTIARTAADLPLPFELVFADEMPGFPDAYPVMQSMVALLISTDRAKFLAMIDDLKQGKQQRDALMEHFGWTTDDLVREWKKFAKR